MKLKELRNNLKITQKQVAESVGLTVQTYVNYELGRRQPDKETLIKLADFFNVSLDELLERKDCKFINLNFVAKEQRNIIETILTLNHDNLIKVETYAFARLEEQNSKK